MKKSVLILGLFLAICWSGMAIAYSNHGYPYSMTSGCTATCVEDDLHFCKNNCTSYAAYVLKEVYGVPFSNSYGGTSWSHGGHWNDATSQVSGQNIAVDKYPIPGDIAYWEFDWTGDPNNHNDDYGHVAFVEKVHYDSNGNAIGIKVSEYNYSPSCNLSVRSINEQEINIGSADYPDGFIHILAYNEGVTSLHYLDCYDSGNLCDYQTPEEWGWIVNRVWNEYRCENCASNYDQAFIDSMASGFGGGSSDGGGSITSPLNLTGEFRMMMDGRIIDHNTEALIKGVIYKAKADLTAHDADTVDWMETDKETVEADIDVMQGTGGVWINIGTVHIPAADLNRGDRSGAKLDYIIPETHGESLSFRVRVNTTNEAIETRANRADNESEVKTYQVKNTLNTNLIVSYASLTGGRTFLKIGETIGIQAAVRNLGTDMPLVTTRLTYSAYGPSTGYSWAYLAKDDLDPRELAPGLTQSEAIITEIPGLTTIAGWYTGRACADSGNAIAETNEADNCFTFPFEVKPIAPNLYIAALGLREGLIIKRDRSVHPWCIIGNNGIAAPASNVHMHYYINWDRFRDDDTIYPGALAPGATAFEEIVSNEVKLGDLGARTYRCCVDPHNSIFELNEGDNCATIGFTVVK